MNNNIASRSAHTNHTARTTKCVLGALALAFAVTACSPAAAENAHSEEAAPAAVQGPLTEMLNGALGLNVTPAEQERQWAEQNRRQEELIAQCMTEAGFEYIPNLPTSTTNVADLFRMDDREWVAQFGYAMVRTPWDATDAKTERTNPNDAYTASLSVAELAAYNDALFGSLADVNYVGSDNADDIQTMLANGGCWGAAQDQVISESAASALYTDEFAPLTDAIMAFFDDQRQEITEADRQWVTCMADAGHTGFQRQSDAEASIEAAYDNILASFNWDAWDVEAFGYPSAANNTDLANLADKEVTLAVADFDCRVATNFDASRGAFQVEAEKQFVADYRAELDALMAAAEQR